MGLDLYLRHVIKPDIKPNTLLTTEDCEENGLSHFTKKEYADLPNSIKNKCVIVKLKSEYYNLAKILSDNNFNPDSSIHLCGLSSDETDFSVYENDEQYNITIPNEDIDEKYSFSQINKIYIVKLEEIDYQRKGLNNDGWDLLPGNCEYCDDKSRIQKLCDIGGLSKSFIENWIDGETVFFAWW